MVVSWLVLGIGMGNWECVPIPGYELCGSELVALVLGVRHGIGMGNWEYVPIVHGKIITTHFLGHIHTHTHTHTGVALGLWFSGCLGSKFSSRKSELVITSLHVHNSRW